MAAGQGDLQRPAGMSLAANLGQVDLGQAAHQRGIGPGSRGLTLPVDRQRRPPLRSTGRSAARACDESGGVIQPVQADDFDAGHEPSLVDVLARHGNSPVTGARQSRHHRQDAGDGLDLAR